MARKALIADGEAAEQTTQKQREVRGALEGEAEGSDLVDIPGEGARLEWWAVERVKAHPLNWRTHPAEQKAALAAVMGKVGWAGAIVFNEVTGHIVDGHLRYELALERGEPEVPVFVVRLSADKERLALASFDTLSWWAEGDAGAFAELRDRVSADFAGVAGELEAEMAAVGSMFEVTGRELVKAEVNAAARTGEPMGGWWVSVECGDERTQEAVYAMMTGEGREVRVLTL